MNARTSYGPSSSSSSPSPTSFRPSSPPSQATPSDVRLVSQISEIAPEIAPQSRPASALDAAQWLIHVEGGEVVGPVSANQVARGMRAGRVPSEASIQAVGEVFWTGLLDEPAIIAALKSI